MIQEWKGAMESINESNDFPNGGTFACCHEKFQQLAAERGWDQLENDPELVELLKTEKRIAEKVADADIAFQVWCDADEFNGAQHDISWSMLVRAAKLGHMTAIQTLAESYYNGYCPEGVNFDKAIDWALEYLRRGGEAEDFEYLSIRPAHDEPIDKKTKDWFSKVSARIPSPESRYVLARSYWDIEKVVDHALILSCKMEIAESQENVLKASELYRTAADEGYFWSQYYFGLYLARPGGNDVARGIGYLEKALANIPELPVPEEDCVENEETRDYLRSCMNEALFKCTGRASERILELESKAKDGDTSALVDLTIEYIKGKECHRDLDKALECVPDILFEEKIMDLLCRMDDLPEEDRKWLEKNLHAIANDCGLSEEDAQEEEEQDPDDDPLDDSWMFPDGHDDGESIDELPCDK